MLWVWPKKKRKKVAPCGCLVCGIRDNVGICDNHLSFYEKYSRAPVVSKSLNAPVIFSVPLSGFRGRGG